MSLAAVLPLVCRQLDLRDLQALFCCQCSALVSTAVVEQRYQLSGAQLLSLLALARTTKLVCQTCFRAPISHIDDERSKPRRECAGCGLLVCRGCYVTCKRGADCRASRDRVSILCLLCARDKCAARRCASCECVKLLRCGACSARICQTHSQQCALCKAACCAVCATAHVAPILATTHTLCAACADKHRATLARCAELVE
jgi:hypothetical protein